MDAATMVCSKFGNFKPKSAIKSTGGGSGFRHAAAAVRPVPLARSRASDSPVLRQLLDFKRRGPRPGGTYADPPFYWSGDPLREINRLDKLDSDETYCLDKLDFDFDENLFFQSVVPLKKYDPLGRHVLVIGFGYQKGYPKALWQLHNYHASNHAAAVYDLSSLPHVHEAAFICRCNSFEIYAVVLDPINALEELCAWMSKESGIPLKKLRFCCYWHFGRNAWRHLFKGTSGLRNSVPEGSHLGQVREIVDSLDGFKGFGRIMKTLFEHAISVGERVTSEVKLLERDHSLIFLASAAVELALISYRGSPASVKNLQRRRDPLLRTKADPQILVIGTSSMSFFVIVELVRKGYRSITLVQELLKDLNMESLMSQYGIEEEGGRVTCKPWGEMASCIAEADIVFACKLLGHEYHGEPYIHEEDVFRDDSLKEPPTHLKVFVDTSLPHSIDEDGVSQLSFTSVLNMDDIEKVVLKKRERVRDYIEEEVGKFESWFNKWGAVHILHSVRGFMKLKYARELEERRPPHVVVGSKAHHLWKVQVERVSRGRACSYMSNFIAELGEKILADLPLVDCDMFPLPQDDKNTSKNEGEEE